MSLNDDADLDAIFASWDSAPLGAHLLKAQYGLSIRGEETGRYPILRMNCQLEGKVVFRDLQFVDLPPEQFEAFRVKDGDLLFNRTNSIELVGRTSVFRSPREAVFASYLIRLTLDQNVWHPEFVNLFLNMPAAQRGLKKLASRGVSQANINASKLRDFLVPKPPIDEQRKIAAVLGKVQAAVAVEGDLVRVARELKQAALRQLFTRGLRHEPQKQTTLGPVPESWEVAEAGSLCRFSSGGTPDRGNPAYWTGGTIPWVKTGEVNYRTISEVEECITELGLQNSAAKLLPPGTLVMAMYGQGVTRGRVARLGIAATTNQACAAISPHADSGISTDFLYHFFEFNYEYLRSLGHGANQKNLNLEIIRQVSVPVPPEAEQREIAALLATLDAKIAHHEARQALLRELFRTLLHDLLTARRRVTTLDLSEDFFRVKFDESEWKPRPWVKRIASAPPPHATCIQYTRHASGVRPQG